jgi:hypothetical protein
LIDCTQGQGYLDKEEERREDEASFARERLVVVGFMVRITSLQKFSPGYELPMSPFDHSPPLLLVIKTDE